MQKITGKFELFIALFRLQTINEVGSVPHPTDELLRDCESTEVMVVI